MNRALASVLTFSLVLAACQFSPPGPGPGQTSTPAPDPLQADWEDRSIFGPGLVDQAQSILEGLEGASVYHLEFTIREDLSVIAGKETVRYTNTEDANLNEIQLRLFPNILGGTMDISSVTLDGKSVSADFRLERSLAILPLTPPLEPGKSVTLEMDYRVVVPQTLDLNYGVLAYANDVLALAHAYPMVGVYDDEGWNAEIPPQSGDVTYADMSFYIARVTAPVGVTLVASGREVGRSETGQNQVVTFASGPARDFYLTASPGYETVERQAEEVTLRFHVPGSLRAGAEAGLDVAARAVEIFSARYAAYPYTELDLVSTPTLALGIEYPGMIAITDRIIGPGEPYLEATVVHEVAHQWFYNLVGNDQLDDPWLDESLAQWATLQYYMDEYGEKGAQGFRASLTGRWDRSSGKAIPIGLPVADYTSLDYGAIIYGRGPLFFEALREAMGAPAFDAFLREYTQAFAWGIAAPEGLEAEAEEACGCDLTRLFEEWVYP